MADTELDKTIEELEAEVIIELEEGMHDAPKKSAVPAEPMKKAKNGEMQDTGVHLLHHQLKEMPLRRKSLDPQRKSLVTLHKREKGNHKK